jgi:diguanylate cyclase (GGDEF)-like protein
MLFLGHDPARIGRYAPEPPLVNTSGPPGIADHENMSLHRHLWMYWLAFGAAVIGGYFLLPQDTGLSNIYYDALSASIPLLIVVGVRLHRPAKARLWYLLAAGQGTWAIGDVVYGVNRFVLDRDPWPSEADVVYLLGYPVMAAALLVLIRGRTTGRDRAGLIDASIIATGLTLVVWVFIMRETMAADDSVLGRLTSMAYPIGDIALLALLARLIIAPGARTGSYRLLVSSLLVLMVVDIIYTYVTTVGVYQGGLIDLGWLTSYVLCAAAALHPSMRSLSETAPERAERLTAPRAVLLTATTLLAPVILIEQGLVEKDIAWEAVSACAIILFLLVLTRMFGLVAQVQDQAEQLDALAHNDALTGVPNRRAWDLELARRMANARRADTEIVVAILDLDHFKKFNDRYGHQAGDRLLKEAAAAWRAQLRDSDLLARYGGEEFGVCITGMSAPAAARLLERVLAATPLGQTFSGGVAAWTGDEAPERLVARADAALYEAKNAGRARVMVHDGQSVSTPRTISFEEITG